MIKKGIVSLVAKTGGIKLVAEDEWYNPDKSFSDYANMDLETKKELKGKEVEMEVNEINEKFYFKNIKAINKEQNVTKSIQNVTNKFDTKNSVRQTCINAIGHIYRGLGDKIGTSIEMKEILEEAEELENWILRG